MVTMFSDYVIQSLREGHIFPCTPEGGTICIGYWIHKSAICAHILHEFVVLPEAQPSAKKHKRV